MGRWQGVALRQLAAAGKSGKIQRIADARCRLCAAGKRAKRAKSAALLALRCRLRAAGKRAKRAEPARFQSLRCPIVCGQASGRWAKRPAPGACIEILLPNFRRGSKLGDIFFLGPIQLARFARSARSLDIQNPRDAERYGIGRRLSHAERDRPRARARGSEHAGTRNNPVRRSRRSIARRQRPTRLALPYRVRASGRRLTPIYLPCGSAPSGRLGPHRSALPRSTQRDG